MAESRYEDWMELDERLQLALWLLRDQIFYDADYATQLIPEIEIARSNPEYIRWSGDLVGLTDQGRMLVEVAQEHDWNTPEDITWADLGTDDRKALAMLCDPGAEVDGWMAMPRLCRLGLACFHHRYYPSATGIRVYDERNNPAPNLEAVRRQVYALTEALRVSQAEAAYWKAVAEQLRGENR